ncbi:MAG TPA: hypothetical protein VKT30_02255 [Caulobacteraceae bacterium]|nr:hypothetical protein [Caulobacteraceae bacterium]
MKPPDLGERVAWLESQALAYEHIIASLVALLHHSGAIDGSAFATWLEAHAGEREADRSGQVAGRIVFQRQAEMIHEQLAAVAGRRSPAFSVIPGGKDGAPDAESDLVET